MPPMPYQSLLEEALEAWAYTRRGVIAEVKNIPDKDFGFRPTPENRSVAELVHHLIQSGLMMSGELTRPDGDFQRQDYADFLEEHAGHIQPTDSKKKLLALLKSTHAQGEKKFREAGELLMLQYLTRFDGLKGTRLAWMYHGISHEEYHRGQLALYARLLGLVPALTKRILSAAE
ncbi:MAG: DinB family protein [candidate division KSB1 bacterium]|nr:DinB family protein [candidate division KSB1 bacterium]